MSNLEKIREYPHSLDEESLEALLDLRGYRASKVTLRPVRPITALLEDTDLAEIIILEPGSTFEFHGSNVLDGSDWFVDRVPVGGKPYPDHVKDWAEGRQVVNIGNIRYRRPDRDWDSHKEVWVDLEDLKSSVEVVGGLWTEPGTREDFEKLYFSKRDEFIEFNRKFIRKEDAKFRTHEGTKVAQNTTPIRHPKGRSHTKHDREFFWNDALWCGDISGDPLVEFFELDFEDMEDKVGPRVAEDSAQIFDQVFREELPDLAHLLEG